MREVITFKIGQKMGRLTIIDGPVTINKKKQWVCECDCGRQTIVVGTHLKGGHTKSCGCLRKEISSKNGKISQTPLETHIKLGQRFNRLTVISLHKEYLGNEKQPSLAYKCECDCGKVKLVRKAHLRSGVVKSCGCLRRENAFNLSKMPRKMRKNK
jgi:hypothetical protein